MRIKLGGEGDTRDSRSSVGMRYETAPGVGKLKKPSVSGA